MAAAAAVAAAGSLASGLGSIGSGIGSGISQKRTNDLNLQINRENNAFNKQMMEEQMRYNTEMYERSLSDSRETWKQQFADINAYNDPSAQLDRLEKAGVNRQLAAAGLTGSASVASPSSSAGTSNGVTPAQSHGLQLQAPKYDVSSLGQAVEAGVNMYTSLKRTASDTALTDEQRLGEQLSNAFYTQRVISEIYKAYADAGYSRARAKTEDATRGLQVNKMQTDIINGLQNFQRTKEIINGIRIQNAMESIKLQNLPQQIQLDLAQKVANIANLYSQAELNRASAKNQIQQAYKNAYDAAGVRIKNSILSATVDEQIDRITKENEMLQKQIDFYLPPREAKLWNIGESIINTAGDFLLYRGSGKFFK